jgi:hypothetical protein
MLNGVSLDQLGATSPERMIGFAPNAFDDTMYGRAPLARVSGLEPLL